MKKYHTLKTMVRGAYDLQKLRIQMGNRLVTNFKSKLGQSPGMSEEDLDAEAKKLLSTLRSLYKKITDGLKKPLPTKADFKEEGIISDYAELCLLSQYISLEKDEEKHFKQIETILEDFPIYTEWLSHIRGIGPTMSAVIISEIDIHKAKYASKIHKYAGLDVAPDGRGRGLYAEHLRDCEYVAKNGETKIKKGITFNPFLKAKLIGVLATNFLRTGNEKYAIIYQNYKHRLENHEKYKNTTKGHRHNMAMRYMIKRFLCDLYEAWRPLEGLEIFKPYEEAKLGMKHTGTEG